MIFRLPFLPNPVAATADGFSPKSPRCLPTPLFSTMVAALTTILLGLWIVCPASADIANCVDMLDQSMVDPALPSLGGSLSSYLEWAQGITIGIPGTVSRLRFKAWRGPLDSTDVVTVELRRNEGGRPSSQPADVVASVAIPGDRLPDGDLSDWIEVDFQEFGVVVSAGERIDAVWNCTSPDAGALGGYASSNDPTDRYPGGGLWFRAKPNGYWNIHSAWGNPDDFDFMLYVCGSPVSTQDVSWGRLKATYR